MGSLSLRQRRRLALSTALPPPLRLAFSEVFLWIQRTVYRFTV